MKTAPWGGPLAPTTTQTAVRCRLCGFWDSLTLIDGEFYCRDTETCLKFSRAPQAVKDKLAEKLAGLAAS